MYYSPTKEFIFLHSRKVAGSSIKTRLAGEHADHDVMIGGWTDAVGRGIGYNKQAFLAAKSQKLNYSKTSIKNFLDGKSFRPTPIEMNRFIKHYYQSKFCLDGGAHASAASIKRMLGDRWDQAFKFTFVRNPWDHAVSDYYWRRGPQKGASFKEFLCLLHDPKAADPCNLRPPITTNWSVYTIDDQIAVDFVGRFERLNSDLAKVSSKIGIDLTKHLQHEKPRDKDNSKSLAAHYNDESIELVRDIFRKEIETFCYQVPF